MYIHESDFDSAIEKSPSNRWLAPLPNNVISRLSEIGVSDALVGFSSITPIPHGVVTSEDFPVDFDEALEHISKST